MLSSIFGFLCLIALGPLAGVFAVLIIARGEGFKPVRCLVSAFAMLFCMAGLFYLFVMFGFRSSGYSLLIQFVLTVIGCIIAVVISLLVAFLGNEHVYRFFGLRLISEKR